MIEKAAILVSRWTGSIRSRRLKIPERACTEGKTKEILFLEDQVGQLKEQVTILRNLLSRKGKKALNDLILHSFRSFCPALLASPVFARARKEVFLR